MASKSSKAESASGVGVFVVVLVVVACVYGWFDGDSETEEAGDSTNVTQDADVTSFDSPEEFDTQEPSEPESTTEETDESKSPERKVDLCGAPQNPFGYNFCGTGGLIYDPAGGVCGYFACIDYFENGKGHMVKCGDGMYSMSGGRRGVCSHHDGHQQDVFGG